jgi:hypothetical protein
MREDVKLGKVEPTRSELLECSDSDFVAFLRLWRKRTTRVIDFCDNLAGKVAAVGLAYEDTLSATIELARKRKEEINQLIAVCTPRMVLIPSFSLVQDSREQETRLDRKIAIRRLALITRSVMQLREIVLQIEQSYQDNI